MNNRGKKGNFNKSNFANTKDSEKKRLEYQEYMRTQERGGRANKRMKDQYGDFGLDVDRSSW